MKIRWFVLLYPCSIPGSISSVDIVVRHPQTIIEKNRISDFISDC